MAGSGSKLADFLRDPRHGGPLPGPSAVGRASLDGRPPYTISYLKIADETVRQISFQTFACVVSMASCEALAQLAEGQSLAQCAAISEEQVFALLGEVPFGRRYCVGLAVDALRAALESYHRNVSGSLSGIAEDDQTSGEE